MQMNKNRRAAIIGAAAMIAIVVVAICKLPNTPEATKNDVEEITKSQNADNDVYELTSVTALVADISDPEIVNNRSANIVMARIDSIDGGSNYSEVYDDYVFPYTYGHMTVVGNLKGDLTVGESIRFYRLGGTISLEQFYAGMAEAEREKFGPIENSKDFFGDAKMVKYVMRDDVEPEAGKIYLMYLNPDTVCSKEPGGHIITGFQGGLREIKMEGNDTHHFVGIKVLNNFTGEWEDLSSVFATANQILLYMVV